jgi:hypothetical protein
MYTLAPLIESDTEASVALMEVWPNNILNTD